MKYLEDSVSLWLISLNRSCQGWSFPQFLSCKLCLTFYIFILKEFSVWVMIWLLLPQAPTHLGTQSPSITLRENILNFPLLT